MQFRKFGNLGWNISEIGLGTSKGLVEKNSKKDSEDLISKALDLGINFIDTARHYGGGEAETRVGEACKKFDRSKIFITTKCCTQIDRTRDFSRKAIIKSFEESLNKLQTDYLDVYLLHTAPDSLLKQDTEALDTLLELKEKGLVRAIGASVDGEAITLALQNKYFDVLEISYNIANLYPEQGFFETAKKQGIGLIIKEPLAVANFYRPAANPPRTHATWKKLQGYDFLKNNESKISAIETSLRFVLSSPYIHTAVQATSNIDHLVSNVALSDGKSLETEICELIRFYYSKN